MWPGVGVECLKQDKAVSEAKKNCRLMILDFRLEPPPQADWLMQGGNECGNISQKGRQKECRREYMCFFPGSYR